MTISNVKQKVNNSKYGDEFLRIFGKQLKNFSGSYKVDKKTGKLIRTGKAKILKNKMDRMVEKIRSVGPITIKRNANANRTAHSARK
jgi:hypothetical protein